MTGLNEAVLVEAFLSDLKSDELLLRELAVSQLSRFTHLPQILPAIKAAEEDETDQELRKQINTLIQLIMAERESPENTITRDSGQTDENQILTNWLSGRMSGCSELLGQLQKLTDEIRIRTTATLIKKETKLHRLVPLFKWPPEMITAPETMNALVSRISDNDYVFTLRLISFLADNSTGLLTRNLQKLLQNPHSLVKAEAIRFLFKLSKPHALRLMEELILSGDKNRRAASTFLLLLPFNDIKHLVLSLIECGSLKDDFLQKLLYHLVYNNPDLDFFKRLTVIELLRRDEIPEITALRMEAAEALSLSEMISEDKSEFCRNSLTRIADYIRRKSGISVKIDTEQESSVATEILSQPADKSSNYQKGLDESVSARLAAILAQNDLAEPDKKFVMQILNSVLNDDERRLLLRIIYRFRPAGPAVTAWLENALGKSNPEDSMVILKVLANMSPSRLLPHLPVLCLSDNESVSIYAIKLFRKHNPKMFARQVEKWLQEDNEATWKAARASMLMMRIEESRDILTRAFYSTQRISMIKFFAPVFRVSPDHISLYELERLLDTCRGKKKELLSEEIRLLKEALGLVSQGETEDAENSRRFAALQIGWDEFRKGLEKIRYISRNQIISEEAARFFERHHGKLAILLVLAFSLAFWPDTELSKPTAADRQTIKTEFKLAQSPTIMQKGEIKVFELVEYEPITRLWRARSLSGEPCKLELTNYRDFKKGFKGNFLVTDYRLSTLGHTIVSCQPSN